MKGSVVAIVTVAGILPALAVAQSGGFGVPVTEELDLEESIDDVSWEESPPTLSEYRVEPVPTQGKREPDLEAYRLGDDLACPVRNAVPIPTNRGCPMVGRPAEPAMQTQNLGTSQTPNQSTRTAPTLTTSSSTTSSSTTTSSTTSSTSPASTWVPPYRFPAPWSAPLRTNWTMYVTNDIDQAYQIDEVPYFQRGNLTNPPNPTAPLEGILNGSIYLASMARPITFQSELDLYNASRLVIGRFDVNDPLGAQAVKLQQVSNAYNAAGNNSFVYHGFTFAVQSSSLDNMTAYSQDSSNLNAPWEVLIAVLCGYLPPASGVTASSDPTSPLIMPGEVPNGTVTQPFLVRNPLGIANIVQAFNGTDGVGMLNFCTNLVGHH